MLRDEPIANSLFVNVIFCVVWHYATFFLCISIDTAVFSPERKMYLPRKWERDGKFYSDVFKINKWKDFLPQHIGKDGFSKDHIDDVSIEYLDEFIMETCRGEWNHTMNCVFGIAVIAVNGITVVSVVLSTAAVIGNVPFAMIQRYNRFRLQKLRRTIVRKMERQHQKQLIAITPVETDTESTVNET